VAPVSLFYCDDPEQLRAVAYASGEITHTHPLGREGAALQAYAVALAVKEDPFSRLDIFTFLGKLRDFTSNEVYKEKLEKVESLVGEADKRGVCSRAWKRR